MNNCTSKHKAAARAAEGQLQPLLTAIENMPRDYAVIEGRCQRELVPILERLLPLFDELAPILAEDALHRACTSLADHVHDYQERATLAESFDAVKWLRGVQASVHKYLHVPEHSFCVGVDMAAVFRTAAGWTAEDAPPLVRPPAEILPPLARALASTAPFRHSQS